MINQIQYPALHVMAAVLQVSKDENAFVQAHHIATELDNKGYLIVKSAFYRQRRWRSLYLGIGLGASAAYPLILGLSWLLH
jgi:hypothetical protein